MLNTSTIIAKKLIGTSLAASVFIKNGVIKGETRVEHAVIVTANATFPFAR